MIQKRFLIIAGLLIASVTGLWYYKSAPSDTLGGSKAETGVTVGKLITPFSLKTLTGETVVVKPAGRVGVINFWATWCPPCRVEMPELNKFAEKYHEKVSFYAVNIQEDREKVKEFMARNNYTMTVLLDADGKVAQTYRINAIPTTLIVNARGEIVHRKSGTMTMSELEELIKDL